MAMIAYNTVHTGPKNHEGGDQVGFTNCEYQLYVFIFLFINCYFIIQLKRYYYYYHVSCIDNRKNGIINIESKGRKYKLIIIKNKHMKLNIIEWIALVLVIVGGLNWGLIGVFNFDLVATIFGAMSMLSRTVYTLVGLSAIYLIFTSTKLAKE